jgi:hypothetical protein
VALWVAVALALALALGVLVSVATVHDLARHGGSLPGGLFIAGVLLALAWGMYQRRYWAVLGFEALLTFQIIVTSLALIVAETLLAAGLCALSIGLAGWLFWKLVRVMARIQAQDRLSPSPGPTSGPRSSAAYVLSTLPSLPVPRRGTSWPGSALDGPGARLCSWSRRRRDRRSAAIGSGPHG